MRNRLKELRGNKSLDVVESETGINRVTFSQYERGKREPKMKVWEQLASYFDVPVSYLMGVDDKRYSLKTKNKLKTDIQSAIKKDDRFLPKLDMDLDDLVTEYLVNVFNLLKRYKGIRLDDYDLLSGFKQYAISMHLALIPTEKGAVDFFISRINNILYSSNHAIIEAQEREKTDFISHDLEKDIFYTGKKIKKILKDLENKYANSASNKK